MKISTRPANPPKTSLHILMLRFGAICLFSTNFAYFLYKNAYSGRKSYLFWQQIAYILFAYWLAGLNNHVRYTKNV